jgi:large subunit ribosomal protein L19e
MTIATVRRLAADIFNVGENKVRISPDGLKEVEGALTRSDVRGLIDKGVITKMRPQGRASTGRTGRTGRGRRKGTPVAAKDTWMEKIRAQRRFLAMLIGAGALKAGARRSVYRKMKSGIFRNKRAMLLYLKENGFVAQGFEPKKAEFRKPEPKPKKAKGAKAAEKAAAKPAAAQEQKAANAQPKHEAHSHSKHEKGEQ